VQPYTGSCHLHHNLMAATLRHSPSGRRQEEVVASHIDKGVTTFKTNRVFIAMGGRMTGHWSSLHQQGALSVGCVSHHQGFHGVRIEGGSHKIELSALSQVGPLCQAKNHATMSQGATCGEAGSAGRRANTIAVRGPLLSRCSRLDGIQRLLLFTLSRCEASLPQHHCYGEV
jgi:hypothetical protein